jgi:hypothetical protein
MANPLQQINYSTPQNGNIYSQPIYIQNQINGFFPGQPYAQQQKVYAQSMQQHNNLQGNISFKRRPHTGSRRNQMLQFANNKKSLKGAANNLNTAAAMA